MNTLLKNVDIEFSVPELLFSEFLYQKLQCLGTQTTTSTLLFIYFVRHSFVPRNMVIKLIKSSFISNQE